MAEKYLIVGLGNPGPDYAKTRHNVGFWVVDELARRYDIKVSTKERKAFTGDGIINGKRVLLAKPQTYMNLSGESVRALMDFYRIELEQIIIVHDDLDTPLGTLRLRKTGGHGGQNGLRNIIMHTGGNQSFSRLRFGIGRPPGRMAARDYVLQPFHGDDAILAQQALDVAANAVETWLSSGIDIAMTQFNGGILEESPAPKAKPEEELALAQRAHELAPHDPKPLQALARLYKRLRRLDDAIDAHMRLAALYEKLDQPRSMVSEWEQVAGIRPSLLDVQRRIAEAYEAQGEDKRAAQRWLKLAEYMQGEGDASQAAEAVAEALRINPQHPKALAMRADLHDA